MKAITSIICCFAVVIFFQRYNLIVEASETQYEQIQEQVEQIITTMSTEDMFNICNYDINELCLLETTAFIINDYMEYENFERLLDTDTTSEYYILPYTNSEGFNGCALFVCENDIVSWQESSIKENDYSMKVKEGRFDKISESDIEVVHYCQNTIYEFMFTYVKLKNGDEYIIPFLSENKSSWNSLKFGKTYSIKDFFDIMYRYYDEPTLEELKSGYGKGEEFGGSFLRAELLKKNGKNIKVIYSFGGLTVVIIGGIAIAYALHKKSKRIIKE